MFRGEIPEIVLAIPSYKRPKVETLQYIPWARIYVSQVEEEAYRSANPGADIVAVEPKYQGNIARIRNHILDRELGEGRAVCMVDDDLKGIAYWQEGVEITLREWEIPDFLQAYTLLALDMGVYLWGINIARDRQNYREYTPFGFTSYIGAPFMVHLLGSDLRFDERIPLKEDYDFSLQHLNRYRRVLRVNKFHYLVRQAEQAGGCATMRSLSEEMRQFKVLQKKWGDRIVRMDKSRNGMSGKDVTAIQWDINPVLKVPIIGV